MDEEPMLTIDQAAEAIAELFLAGGEDVVSSIVCLRRAAEVLDAKARRGHGHSRITELRKLGLGGEDETDEDAEEERRRYRVHLEEA